MELKYYVYLISSLPMLHFGARPPFSYARFIAACEGLIPLGETDALRALNLAVQDAVSVGRPILKKWREFDTALRNEMVKIRASRRKIDPSKHLRADGYTEARLHQAVLQAYRNPSPIDGEKALDQEKWHYLDDLSLGHYFDFDALVIYGLKLLVLEKWEKIRSADGTALAEEAIQA